MPLPRLTTPRSRALAKVALLAAAFAAAALVADRSLGRFRLDLTEGQRHTLAPATAKLLASLKEPVTLTLFASESTARGNPQLQAQIARARALVEQMRRASDGKLRVKTFDPEPYSEAEQRAQEAGLAPLQLEGERNFYLGLTATNATDGREALPFLQSDFLEHDLGKAIVKLARGKKPKVGLLAGIPLFGAKETGAKPEDARTTPPWAVSRDLSELFEVVPVAADAKELPQGIDLLVALHPKGCAEGLLKSVDAFARSGKPVILALDPCCLATSGGRGTFQGMDASDFGPLPKAWGFKLGAGEVVGDRIHALRDGAAGRRGSRDYLPFLDLTADTFDHASPFLHGVARLRLPAAGALTREDGATTTFQPLVSVGKSSGLLPVSMLAWPDPESWKRGFSPDDKTRVLAAFVTGPAAPADFTPAPKEDGQAADKKEEKKEPKAPAAKPEGNLKVLVVADADFLHEMWWASPVNVGGRTVGLQKEADNEDFLLQAMDTLALGGDLATLRARGGYDRPFTFVDTLRKEAEAKEMGKLAVLEEKRRDTERKIRQLRQGAEGGKAEATLTPEQKKTLEAYRGDYAKTGEDLRRLRYDLNKDVERLGTVLAAVNAATAPLLVAAGALALASWRLKRRKKAAAGKPQG